MNLKFSWIIFLMWMLLTKKRKGKKGHLHVLNFLKNKQSFALQDSKSRAFRCLSHFSVYLNSFASWRLLHYVLIAALGSPLKKKKLYCMFWGWKWTQTLFVSGSFHFAYNMLTSSVLKHLLSLQNDKGLLIFLNFSCTFLCSIFTSEPSAEDRTEWPVVWEYTISYKYQLSHQKECLWV